MGRFSFDHLIAKYLFYETNPIVVYDDCHARHVGADITGKDDQ
jgi:hypothetical protein